jgi:predicted RNA binding protein YcfA (HicA-like mRNA interferase family)
VVSVLARGPTVAGSGQAEDRGFVWAIKSLARTSFGGEVKPSVPCRRFTACKRTLHSMSEMLCRPNFLTCFSPVIFSCFATRWLWLLNQDDSKFVLRQKVSHLFLKHTKSGYGTVLTAACARQGCSASGLIFSIMKLDLKDRI